MSSVVPISVNAVLIASTETLVGQVPAGKEWDVAVVRFCNLDSVDHQITIVTYDPSVESFGDTTSEYKNLTIQANTTLEYGPVILSQNKKISASTPASGLINARIHGWEVTP